MPTSPEQQASPEQLCDQLVRWYGADPRRISIVFAPYRICPLGAHIDHQLGQVTAIALDRGVTVAFAPHDDQVATMRSLDFPGQVDVLFDKIGEPRPGDWGNYLRGAVGALKQRHPLTTGLVGVTAGRIAEGGLSSSAAVSVAYLLALQQVNQLQVNALENIELVQHIENGYLGLRIGILDQSAILLSRRNALTLIDCQSVTHRHIACRRLEPSGRAPSFRILIAFSGLRKPLGGTDYNRRVSECAEAARLLLDALNRPACPPRLRYVTPAEYHAEAGRLTGPPARRAAHFFSEMERVQRGVEAWERGDLQAFGQLVTASGASSIDNYQCGAPPLIDLYEILTSTPGVLGARFSGAGFRGCCLALVDPDCAAEVGSITQQRYAAQHPDLAADAWTMICHPGDKASLK